MSKIVSPGAQFWTQARYPSTPAQPGVRLVDTTGNAVVARTTSGIVNMGSNIRGRYLTAPLTPSTYSPQWDDSDGPRTPDEDIIVSTIFDDILAAAVAASSGGLTAAPIVLPAGGVSPVVTQSFFIKRGDNEPLIYQVTELDSAGVPQVVDVTGWTGKFKLRAQADVGSVLINQDFYISDISGLETTDGSAGLIAYDWGLADGRLGETDRLGLFLAEFETHRPSGVKKTYPTTSDLTGNREYITVQFVADLDDSGSH